MIGQINTKVGKKLRLEGHNEHANKACPCFNVRAWYAGRKGSTRAEASEGLVGGVATGVGGTVAAVLAASGGASETLLKWAIVGAVVLVVGFLVWKKRRG